MYNKIYLAGHRGFAGSAILRALEKEFPKAKFLTRTKAELDLLNQQKVEDFLLKEKPDLVIIAAAKVGGIMANSTRPAEFLYDNLQIQTNIIHSSYLAKVRKLVFLGSSCIYPRNCPQPMKEEYLMTGDLEPTNYGYAFAKIAGIKMCDTYREQYGCDFTSIQPTNLYGPGDNFDPLTSHAMAALIRKIHEAKINNLSSVSVWGSGKPRREWLYIDDLADALIFVIRNDVKELINIGCGYDFSIQELVNIIAEVIGYKGSFEFDQTKPDGMLRKLLDVSKMKSYGWEAKTEIKEGIRKTYEWFLSSAKSI